MSYTVKQLIDELTKLNEDIHCNGKTTGSHTFPSSVTFSTDEDDCKDDRYFEIKSIEPSLMMGCNCWVGVDITLEEDKQ